MKYDLSLKNKTKIKVPFATQRTGITVRDRSQKKGTALRTPKANDSHSVTKTCNDTRIYNPDPIPSKR